MMRSIIILLLSCSIISPAYSQSKKRNNKKNSSTVVFSVNGKSINSDEFIYLYKKNHLNKSEDFTEEKILEYLDLFINFKLKVEEARQRGMDTTASFIKEYNTYKDELRKPYLPDAKIIDSLVKLTYERLKLEVNASHILVMVKPDATPDDTLKAYNKILDIRNKILSGEDFGKAATTNSEDPTAPSNQGNLGYFTAFQMVFPFETAAYTTPVGQVSKPVRTKFGYHLVKVLDRRPARGEVEVSHIMLRTGNDKNNTAVKNKIFEIHDQLRGGVSWEELCSQYSEDQNSKDKGGRLRPFGVGVMAGVPQFEQTSFALQYEGQISDPIETPYGWHILRLEKKIPLLSLEELTPALKSKVTRDERIQISKEKLNQRLKADYEFKENDLAKSNLAALADTSLTKGRWSPDLSKVNQSDHLFELKNKRYTVKDFLTYTRQNQRPTGLSPEKYLEHLYNNFVESSILKLVEDQIIAQNPDYKMLLNEYYEGILLFEIMEKEVWNKASADSLGQKEYFDTHRAKYTAGERARARIFSNSSGDFIKPLEKLLENGDSSKIQEFILANKIRQEKGAFEKTDKSVFENAKWAPGIYSSENNGMYYLAWILDILPPGLKTFEDARASVISDYQSHLEQSWLNELKKKYAVKVNEKGKRYILENLKI